MWFNDPDDAHPLAASPTPVFGFAGSSTALATMIAGARRSGRQSQPSLRGRGEQQHDAIG